MRLAHSASMEQTGGGISVLAIDRLMCAAACWRNAEGLSAHIWSAARVASGRKAVSSKTCTHIISVMSRNHKIVVRF